MNNSEKSVSLRLKGSALDLEESRWAIIQEVWDEEGLIEHLRNRMEASEEFVRELLESYAKPAPAV